jgi:NAD(P)-dependent dehydrogenase (short-subunit alcohol dehydrogenase family)
MPNLSGETALVTGGASRGIGRASALALAAAGAQVLVHYGRGASEAEGVVAEICKAGGRADAGDPAGLIIRDEERDDRSHVVGLADPLQRLLSQHRTRHPLQ